MTIKVNNSIEKSFLLRKKSFKNYKLFKSEKLTKMDFIIKYMLIMIFSKLTFSVYLFNFAEQKM